MTPGDYVQYNEPRSYTINFTIHKLCLQVQIKKFNNTKTALSGHIIRLFRLWQITALYTALFYHLIFLFTIYNVFSAINPI
jgi:hypothetical protein